MKGLLLLTAALLAGCGVSEETRSRQNTLDTLHKEMAIEDRVANCDGFHYDPDTTFHAFTSWWGSIFTTPPPDRAMFDTWMRKTVCAGPKV